MWLFILIALVLLVALVAVPIGYRGRSGGGQNTTVIERERPADEDTAVVERRYERRTTSD